MNLKKAYGQSCNGFFAKLAINHLGLGIITDYARKFGWQSGIPADFLIPPSPFLPPGANNSSVHAVGRYAAGFGYVGVNAVQAAWMMAVIARDGRALPLRILSETPVPAADELPQVFSTDTATKL